MSVEKYLAYEDFLVQLEIMAVVNGWTTVTYEDGYRWTSFTGTALYDFLLGHANAAGVEILPPDKDCRSCWRYLQTLPMPLIRRLFHELEQPKRDSSSGA